MIVEPLSNPLSNPCRTLCVAPPYTPGRQHSLPACMAVRCLPAVAGRRSWLKIKRNNKPGRAGEQALCAWHRHEEAQRAPSVSRWGSVPTTAGSAT